MHTSHSVPQITGLTNINVTGVALPILDCQTPGQGPTNPESLTRPFMLWGLTWGMVNDIMTMSGVLPNRLDRPRFRYGDVQQLQPTPPPPNPLCEHGLVCKHDDFVLWTFSGRRFSFHKNVSPLSVREPSAW